MATSPSSSWPKIARGRGGQVEEEHALELAGVEFIAENSGGAGVRLKKGA